MVHLLLVNLNGRGDPLHARTLFTRPNNLAYFRFAFWAI